MGLITDGPVAQDFTLDHCKDKSLVIQMLKYEDSIIHSNVGQDIYRNELNNNRHSLFPEHTINRITLAHFNFTTNDQSVLNYREIFRHYYNSPTDYDQEVLSCVTYMRENKCVYYTAPDINLNDTLPDCDVYQLDGTTKTTLYDQLGKNFKYAFVAGFSNS